MANGPRRRATATGIKLNYQAIGSGAGINQINNRTVDFGASDMPVAADDLASHKLMQFPTVIGGVVIIVNIPGVEANAAEADRRIAGRHLSRQDHQVERPEDGRAEPRA